MLAIRKPFGIFCLFSLASVTIYCQRTSFSTKSSTSWRISQQNHEITSYNSSAYSKLCRLSDPKRINTYLDNILISRPVGSKNLEKVGLYLEHTLKDLGYSVEVDNFTQNTIIGKQTFRNIIATLDPSAPRWLTLACHYDSKDFRPHFEFLGAVDSAFPSAVLLDVASSLAPFISNRNAQDVTLQLIFFDGEEAFKDWTATDSLYGSRHLAQLYQNRPYQPGNKDGTTDIHRIDYLVLLDLLGANNTPISNFVNLNGTKIYQALYETENLLRGLNCFDRSASPIFSGRVDRGSIPDDYVPFRQRGVRVMHMIPTRFPEVWHSKSDNRSALHAGTMANIANIMRVFVARYLGIRIA